MMSTWPRKLSRIGHYLPLYDWPGNCPQCLHLLSTLYGTWTVPRTIKGLMVPCLALVSQLDTRGTPLWGVKGTMTRERCCVVSLCAKIVQVPLCKNCLICHDALSRAPSQFVKCTMSHIRAQGEVLCHKFVALPWIKHFKEASSTSWIVNTHMVCFLGPIYSLLLPMLLDKSGTFASPLDTFIWLI